MNRLRLFLSLIHAPWDTFPDGSTYRIDLITAWRVARIVHPGRREAARGRAAVRRAIGGGR
jgi:hypothetical protein